MHRLAQLQHQHDAGLARAYALGSCPMPTTASRVDAPIFWVNVTDTKRRPRPLIFSP
jgi:hypothetical protein